MNDFALPETRYALSGEVNIAYQTMGDGPIDIVLVPGIVSHVEFAHELAGYTAFLRRLSSFAPVVTFDKRGQGLSDRISGAPSLEQRVDDVRAVMDDVGSQQAALLGFSEGSPMSALFAATYPERVSHLLLFGGFAKGFNTEEAILERVKLWGTGAMIKTLMPSQAASSECGYSTREVPAVVGHCRRSKGVPVVEQSDRCQIDTSDRAYANARVASSSRCSGDGRTRPRLGGANPWCQILNIPTMPTTRSFPATQKRCLATSRNLSPAIPRGYSTELEL